MTCGIEGVGLGERKRNSAYVIYGAFFVLFTEKSEGFVEQKGQESCGWIPSAPNLRLRTYILAMESKGCCINYDALPTRDTLAFEKHNKASCNF